EAWDELRSLSPMHRGMSYARLEELGGIQWPCASEDDPGSLFLHGRLWDEPGELARVSSRRGSIDAPVRLDPGLRPGLAFMTFHFPDEIDVNVLTIDATDPKSGTTEFKATAVRVEKANGRPRQAAGIAHGEAGK